MPKQFDFYIIYTYHTLHYIILYYFLLAKAVLQYRAKGKVLDMQAINVQYRYARQNLVRQLIEVLCIFKTIAIVS